MYRVRRAAIALAAILGSLLAGAPAHAHEEHQAPTYRRTPGDTLRFREVTRGEVTITAPQGQVEARTSHDALIALTFDGGDTASAWFEEISLGVDAGPQSLHPSTEALLNRPYTLRFTERGYVQTIRTPSFPDIFAQVSDLARQFDDFFLRLPPHPLREGLTWSDTVTLNDSTSATEIRRMQRVGHYRVTGETTIAGERAIVIRAALETTVDATAPGQPGGGSARAELEGTEDATFYFAPASGRFLGRVRDGEIAGVITIGGADGMQMEQRLEYTSRIDAVR